MKTINLLSLLALILLCSCGKEEYDAKVGYRTAMKNYIKDKGWDANETIEGLFYVITEPGTDEKPELNSNIEIRTKGYYSDNEVFQPDGVLNGKLTGFIQGWKVGIPKFGAGGKGHILFPPNLAYGEFPSNGVRAQSILIFDIELISF